MEVMVLDCRNPDIFVLVNLARLNFVRDIDVDPVREFAFRFSDEPIGVHEGVQAFDNRFGQSRTVYVDGLLRIEGRQLTGKIGETGIVIVVKMGQKYLLNVQ